MKTKHIFFFLLFIFSSTSVFSQNVVIVVIDGARYTETFGDPNRTYVPKMAQLAQSGTYINTFYNDGQTYTSRAIPALWTGTWAGVNYVTIDGEERQSNKMPSIFEYYRKQKNTPDTDALYELKYISSLWLQSFHEDYGKDYWPKTISEGNTDNDVCDNAIRDMSLYHPKLSWIYFADVDHAGHLGVWEDYVNTIKNADSLVNELWNFIQNDDFYKDNTIMLVTNDHGRHTTDFTGHGCSCDGCRHIMFLAIGPNIKQNYISNITRNTPDFAVTAAYILGVIPEYSTGSTITEIFQVLENKDISRTNNFWITKNEINITIENETFVDISIYDLQGRLIKNIANKKINAGNNLISWNNENLDGLFIVTIKSLKFTISKKISL